MGIPTSMPGMLALIFASSSHMCNLTYIQMTTISFTGPCNPLLAHKLLLWPEFSLLVALGTVAGSVRFGFSLLPPRLRGQFHLCGCLLVPHSPPTSFPLSTSLWSSSLRLCAWGGRYVVGRGKSRLGDWLLANRDRRLGGGIEEGRGDRRLDGRLLGDGGWRLGDW